MWSFKQKKQTDTATLPVLRVLVGSVEICSVLPSELPADKQPILELRTRNDEITFIDSRGHKRAFSMATAYDEGARFLHMSVRVGSTYAVQPDGILTETRNEHPQEAYKRGAKGLRFQPFLLPESPGNPADLVGHGLFYRGLHFSGTVSPGNLSLLCICDYCNGTFRLQSFHAGFSDLAYFYCSNGPHTLVASAHEADAPPILGKANPDATSRFESCLPPCSTCGGNFRYMNPFLCPHCGKAYIDFVIHPEDREREYYGNYIYGEHTQRFEAATQQSVAADRREDAAPADR